MIAIPFIYFTYLLLFQLKKNKWEFDIASFILIIYATSAFFSILIDVFGLRSLDTIHYRITPLACFCYLGLITMCIWPFISYSDQYFNRILPVKKRFTLIIKLGAWIISLYFFLNFFMSWNVLADVVLSDDLNQVRKQHGTEMAEETWLASYPPLVRLPFVMLNMIGGCPWVFIFFAFYCLIIQKLKILYFLLFIIASFNGILGNLIDAGRSAIAYWIMSFIACYIIFSRYMNNIQKRTLKRVFVVIGAFAVFFLAAVTIARFGERDAGEVSGTQGGLISYFGQTYINFCYFFDEFTCPLPSLQLVFPFTSKLILGNSFVAVTDLQELISMSSGREIGVFFTFLGHIMVTSNNIVMIIYAILLFFISMLLVRKTKNKSVKLSTCYFYFLYSSVIFLGIFTHFYGGTTRNFSVAFWGIVVLFLSIGSRKTKRINN